MYMYIYNLKISCIFLKEEIELKAAAEKPACKMPWEGIPAEKI